MMPEKPRFPAQDKPELADRTTSTVHEAQSAVGLNAWAHEQARLRRRDFQPPRVLPPRVERLTSPAYTVAALMQSGSPKAAVIRLSLSARRIRPKTAPLRLPIHTPRAAPTPFITRIDGLSSFCVIRFRSGFVVPHQSAAWLSILPTRSVRFGFSALLRASGERA